MAEEQNKQQAGQANRPSAVPGTSERRGTRPPSGRGRSSGSEGRDGDRGQKRGDRPRGRRPEREQKEYDQQILDLARVTRVTKGGKRMRFRVTMVIGDRKGKVGYGIAKGIDVQTSVQKAVNQAEKKMIKVPLQNGTIPHAIISKFASAKVILKPAPKGTGIKAGGAVRVVLEFAGVPNVTAKILGSNSKINNTKATIQALSRLMPALKRPPKDTETAVEAKEEKPIEA